MPDPSSLAHAPRLGAAGTRWPGLARLAGIGPEMPQRLAGTARAWPRGRDGFVVLSGYLGSGIPAASAATDTVYVPIQCATSSSSCNPPSHVVDVINTARCNTKVVSGCRVAAKARVGSGPTSAAIDPVTHTVYVTNYSSNTVSVINGARCNAQVTRGCAQPVATIKVGKNPIAAVVNPATRTLYVANFTGRTVSVINAGTCNAKVTRGCRRPGSRTVTDKAGPSWVDVDTATDTVYVANSGITAPGDTVSVINGAACNARTGRGCHRAPASVTVGQSPFTLTIDQASDTIYVANFVSEFYGGSVSVINGATCNGKITAGCHHTPPAVPTGIGTGMVVLDHNLHTAFAVNATDDTLSAINTHTCNGAVAAGCPHRPPNQQAAPVQGPGYNAFPIAFALIPRTGTAYVASIGSANLLSVTSIRRCNATSTTGCRAEAPTVPDGEFLISADPATNTIYGGNLSKPQIDVINAATCHATDLAGCAPVAQVPVADPGANVGAIDAATHTLYVADPPSTNVFMINTAVCNAENTSGCAAAPPTVKIGAFPEIPAVNPATQTMYVSYGNSANKVAVVNAATCNATDTSGCGQAPSVVQVGQGTIDLAVSTATDTIYAPSGADNTVAVIDGATCNGTDHTGCGHPTATATAGLDPVGVTVNDRTHTVYVANNANGGAPGTVSMINAATCNGSVTNGCHQRLPVMATGNSPLLIAASPRAGTLYVTDFSSASVTVLNTEHCNAAVTNGCARASRERAVGSGPFGIAINPSTGTVYAANGYLPGTMSILKATQH